MAKLRKLSVTYHAPEGDSRVVDNMGATFYDGQSTEVIVSPEDEERLKGNSIFEVTSAVDHEGEKTPPSPPKAKPAPEAKDNHKK